MTLNNRIPPPLVAIAMAALMWVTARQWPADPLPAAATYGLCGTLLALALGLDFWALLAFRRARTTINPLAPEKASAIVQVGPYRFSRNPMYLGLALMLTACAVWFGQPLNLLLVAVFVAYMTAFQIKPEEAAIEASFGQEFLKYRDSVRRWI